MLRILCERRQRELTKGRRKSDGVSAQARYDVSANHVVLYQSLVYDALAQAVSPNLHLRIMRLETEVDSIFRSYFTQHLEQFDAEFARSDEGKRRKLLGPTMKPSLRAGRITTSSATTSARSRLNTTASSSTSQSTTETGPTKSTGRGKWIQVRFIVT